MPTNQDMIIPPSETTKENQTNEPFMSRKIGKSTLSLNPHKIGIKAINVIIALIACRPNDSTIRAHLLQSS